MNYIFETSRPIFVTYTFPTGYEALYAEIHIEIGPGDWTVINISTVHGTRPRVDGTTDNRITYEKWETSDQSPDTTVEDDFLDPDFSFDFDLLAYYHILKRRMGCNKLKLDYAKSKTRAKFYQIVNSMNFGIYKLNLYVYLISYRWIFNLDMSIISPSFHIIGNYQFQPRDPDQTEYRTINDDIPKWIKLISEAIDKLD